MMAGPKHRWLPSLLMCAMFTPGVGRVFSQSGQGTPPPRITGQESPETRGEALFTRHCPICHLGRPSASRPYVGRNLRGILKNAKPPLEASVREAIRKGGDKMPGFQYNLTPAQIDDLIAYLRTYN
jgi:mono/diheme cytochrome c family protein